MPRITDTIMVRDSPWNRAVKITITGPDVSKFVQGSDEIKQLGKRAWEAPGHQIKLGDITVKAEAFRR